MDNAVGVYQGAQLIQEPVMVKLEREKKCLEQKLQEVNDAIQALKDNPEFQKLYDILGKVVRY